jgi:hypothetical protein
MAVRKQINGNLRADAIKPRTIQFWEVSDQEGEIIDSCLDTRSHQPAHFERRFQADSIALFPFCGNNPNVTQHR